MRHKRVDRASLSCSCGGRFDHSDDTQPDGEGVITSTYYCESCDTLFILDFIPGNEGEEDSVVREWYIDASGVEYDDYESETKEGGAVCEN